MIICFDRIRFSRVFESLILFFLCGVVFSELQAEQWDAFFLGDMQLRGYETHQLYSVPAEEVAEDGLRHSDNFGWAQLNVSADVTYADRYHAFLTLRSRARWGSANHSDLIEADMAQAWIDCMNISFSPLSIKLGRQPIGFGNGLILSDEQNEWIYDALRGTWDALPLVVDVAGGRTADCSRDTAVESFYLFNIQRETEIPFIKQFELYQGVFDMSADARPVLFGLRNVFVDIPKWLVQMEAAYECGERPEGKALSAWLLDAGITRTQPLADVLLSSVLRYTYASGDGLHQFVDLMNSDQWGQVFKPRLSNMHIISWNNTIEINPALQIGLNGFCYIQDCAEVQVASRPGYESDGYGLLTDGTHRELGTEVDVHLNWQASEQLGLQFHAGHFRAGRAYATDSRHDASEIRIQAVLEF